MTARAVKERVEAVLVVGAFMIVVFGILGSGWSAKVEQEAEQRFYCQMTRLYIETGGEYGWPDYRGNRNSICSERDE